MLHVPRFLGRSRPMLSIAIGHVALLIVPHPELWVSRLLNEGLKVTVRCPRQLLADHHCAFRLALLPERVENTPKTSKSIMCKRS